MAKNSKMTKKELDYFKKLLIEQKQKILDGIKHITKDALDKSQKDAAGDLSGYTYHMADVASDTFEREFSLDLASNEQDMLYDIEDALKRIESREYGFCILCEKKISKERLKAVPYAKSCIECQTKEEKGKRK
jgi:RNA polymerase-binding protein DksA